MQLLRLLILSIFISIALGGILFGVLNITESNPFNMIDTSSDDPTGAVTAINNDENSQDSLNEGGLTHPQDLDFDGYEVLTIPFLRQRAYDTPILEISDTLYSNADFNSYIASYYSDGLKINGLLTIPNKEMPESGHPAIIFLHGYIPPTQYQTTSKYESYVNYLARNGFVVFKIDYRGHGDSEGEPTGAYFSPSYVIDTINAINAISTNEKVDKDKIGLWGHSMSGNILLRTMAVKPEIKAGVIFAGAVYTYKDFREYGIDDNSYDRNSTSNNPMRQRSKDLFEKVGDINDNPDFWNLVAPTSYLKDFRGSLNIHHSLNDDVVSIEYSRNLKKLLDESGVKNNLYEYQSGGHNITDPAFGTAMKRTVEFFNDRLNN